MYTRRATVEFVTKGGRTTKMTSEMADHTFHLKQQKCKNMYSTLREGMSKVMQAMEDPPDHPPMQDLYKDFVYAHEDYLKAEEEFLDFLSKDDQAAYHDNNKEISANISDVKNRVQSFLMIESAKHRDNVSDIGARSVQSSGSSVRSNASMIRLREEQTRAELNTKAIALQQQYEMNMRRKSCEQEQRYEAARLESQLLIEKQRLDDKMEMSRLEFDRLDATFKLKTELAISEAKTQVLDKFELDDDCSSTRAKRLLGNSSIPRFNIPDVQVIPDKSAPTAQQQTQFHQVETAAHNYGAPQVRSTTYTHSALDVRAPLYVPNVPSQHPLLHSSTPRPNTYDVVAPAISDHAYQSAQQGGASRCVPSDFESQRQENPPNNDLSRLADLLASKQDYLPRMEPDIFDGDILMYPLWINSFETIIEERVLSPIHRLYYLSKYTSGSAKESIQGLLSLKTPNAYKNARATLDERYGHKYKIYEAYRGTITLWPTIKPGDGNELRRFSDFLSNCLTAMESVNYLRVMDDAEENHKMLKKLPRYIVERWSRIVDTSLHGDSLGYRTSTEPRYPSFATFCDFIKREARISCGPVKYFSGENKEGQKQASFIKRGNTSHNARSFATMTHQEKKPSKSPSANENVQGHSNQLSDKPIKIPTCSFCKGTHTIDTCPDFLRLSLQERKAIVRTKVLCWRCLKWGHVSNECRSRKTCDSCGRRHSTAIHDDSYKPPDEIQGSQDEEATEGTSGATANRTEADEHLLSNGCFHSLILPVYLFFKNKPQERIVVYAVLDPQSNACFISESTRKKVNVTGTDIQLKLRTMLGEDVVHCQRIQGLAISSMDNTTTLDLPESYTRDEIAASHEQVATPETVRRWPHLEDISNELHPFEKNAEIGLLIGMNLSRVMKPMNCIPGKDNDPYAIKTVLGWGVIGLVNTTGNEGDSTFCRSVTATERKCHFAFKTHAAEISPAQVANMFAMDFNERNSDEKYSANDRRFLDKLEHDIRQRPDGHLEMPLPFKEDVVLLPNNKVVALKRLLKMKGRLQSNPQYAQDYTGFMNNLIDKGYAERVSADSEAEVNGTAWYLPHHGVYHPKKPGKLRVVFDCSVEFKGEVLNKHLLQGPDQINNLIGILCRFRREPEAFCCDIESMFYQVGVTSDYRDYIRFLWWEDGKIDNDPVEYRMTVHVFGATSSPGCANYALKYTANQFEKDFGTEASEFIRNDFYVDDGLKSVDTPEHAIQLIESSYHLCEKAGFNLIKFTSNNKDVLSSIPANRRAKSVQNMDLIRDEMHLERTLGVQWCLESDTFQFRVVFEDKPPTRRGILSTVSSIFDPLGLLSPVTLMGKKILQDLCRENTDWDEPVSDEITNRWKIWKTDVLHLSALNIQRCYKPKGFGAIRKMELHHFSDASMEGYGACSYIRLIDVNNNISTALVMGKSRVTPAKSITIPRLELAAAVVATTVSNFLKKELHYDDVTNVFWSDSKVALGYIANDSRRFHVYVANRVQRIRDSSSPKQWRHIDSANNPADIASRGSSAEALIHNELWWKGPAFLASLNPLPYAQLTADVQQDDPEVKKARTLASYVSKQFPNLESRLQYFSSWHNAKRAVAVCLRFIQKLRDHVIKKPKNGTNLCTKTSLKKYVPVNVAELQRAELVIIMASQKRIFAPEIGLLQTTRSQDVAQEKGRIRNILSVNPRSSLTRLDPYIDENGLLRVGGRIKRADLSAQIRHPVILPRNSHVTRLVVHHFHCRTEHSGRGITLNEVRSSGYWIIAGRAAVTELIRGCVICRKLRGPLLQQKMGDLPKDRLEPTEPFVYCAVDMFGPFYVKQARSQVKRWGCLFTCLSSRAIHIEICSSLSTDSFINAYRRFICRRGPVRQIRSDQGTNFIGVKSELQSAFAEMDDNKIRREMLRENCDWISLKMNVPYSSHMGGVWERMIRSIRNALQHLLDNSGHQLDDELLRTLMAEAEAIINSRPITYNDLSSPDAPEPLSPYQLLVLKSKVVAPPPGEFVREDMYCRRRWRRVQYLANVFWSRWKSEYLLMLQERNKWTRPSRNLEKDDIVLMNTANAPRNQWPMARVVDTYPSEDGHVRKVKVAVGLATFDRPIHKLVLLINRSIPVQEPTKKDELGPK